MLECERVCVCVCVCVCFFCFSSMRCWLPSLVAVVLIRDAILLSAVFETMRVGLQRCRDRAPVLFVVLENSGKTQ